MHPAIRIDNLKAVPVVGVLGFRKIKARRIHKHDGVAVPKRAAIDSPWAYNVRNVFTNRRRDLRIYVPSGSAGHNTYYHDQRTGFHFVFSICLVT